MSDYEDATELEFDGSLAQQDPFSSSQATERFSLGGDTSIGAGDTTAIAPVSSSDDEADAEAGTGAAGGEGGESGAGAREAAGASVAGDTVARTIRDASASDANTVDPPEDPAAEAMDEIPSDDDSRHEDDDEETEVQGAPGHVALLLSQHLSASATASTGGGTVASRVKDIRAIIDANHRSDKTNLRLDKSGGLSLSQSSDASSSSSHQSQSSSRKRAAAPGAAALVQGQSDARLVALLRTAADLATAAAADDAQRPPSGAPPAAVPSLAGLVQAVLAALPGRSSTEGGGGRSATSRRVLVYTTALDLLLATTPTPTNNPASWAGGDEEVGGGRDDGEGGLPDQLCREVVEVLVAHLDEFPTTHIVKIVERCLRALRTVERHHQQGGSSPSSSSSSSSSASSPTVSLRLECLSLIPKCLESLVGVTPVDPKGLCG